MAKLKETRLPNFATRPDGASITRVVLEPTGKDYRNAPGNREIARRKRQHANTKAAAR